VLGVGAERSLDVATGDGVLEIVRLQFEGTREMDGAEFAASVSAGRVTQTILSDAGATPIEVT
jgi:methionyl-tRNA formyltransferase